MSSIQQTLAIEPAAGENRSDREDLFRILSARCLPVRTCRKGAWILTQGDVMDHLYVVKEGVVLLTRYSSCGRETLLGFVRPGEFFGDVSLLKGGIAPFNAMALQKSVLLVMPKSDFKRLMENPAFCRGVAAVLADRCSDAWTHIEALGSGFLAERIRTLLAWLGRKIGVQTEDGIEISLSQVHLAQMAGVSRESLNRQLGALKQEGIIRVSRRNQRTSLLILATGKISAGAM